MQSCTSPAKLHCHGPALPRRSLARSGRMWQQERDPCLDISCSGSASQVEQGPRAVLLQRSFLPMRIKSPPTHTIKQWPPNTKFSTKKIIWAIICATMLKETEPPVRAGARAGARVGVGVSKRRKLDGSVTDRCHSVPPVPHTPHTSDHRTSGALN